MKEWRPRGRLTCTLITPWVTWLAGRREERWKHTTITERVVGTVRPGHVCRHSVINCRLPALFFLFLVKASLESGGTWAQTLVITWRISIACTRKLARAVVAVHEALMDHCTVFTQVDAFSSDSEYKGGNYLSVCFDWRCKIPAWIVCKVFSEFKYFWNECSFTLKDNMWNW